jgi:signal transduction histidine kinase
MEQILVIDDEQAIREMVAECLRPDYDVVTVGNGLEGLDQARTFCPDLVICDVNMPMMDGFAVYDCFQKTETLKDAVFVFLSGSSDNNAVRHGMTLGADDFLLKPFLIDELLEVVRRRLDKRAEKRMEMNRQIDELRLNITRALPHELRTSIMIMEGYASLILDDPDNQDIVQREMMENILNGASRLRHMAEKYLWYLRSLLPERIDPDSTTPSPDATVQECAYAIAKRFDRVADLNIQVSGVPLAIDPEYFTRIMEEILENSVKFSTKGTPISVTTNLVERNFRIIVSNFGREITPEQVQRIGAFMQFERSRYEQQGTGLGLIIAKRLIELHGGYLTINANEGKTEVSITLLSRSNERIVD